MTKIMNPIEISYVAMNMEAIEEAIGGPIPNGLLDISQYSNKILNPIEVSKIAMNIDSLMRARNSSTYRNPKEWEVKLANSSLAKLFVFFSDIFLLAIILILVTVFTSVAFNLDFVITHTYIMMAACGIVSFFINILIKN